MTSLGQWFGGRSGGYNLMWFGSPYSSDMWDPINNGAIWNHDQDQDNGGGSDDDETKALAPAHVDCQGTQNAHVFHADLPGVRKEQVNVQLKDGSFLQISREKSEEQRDSYNNDKRHFYRRFRLPENANSAC